MLNLGIAGMGLVRLLVANEPKFPSDSRSHRVLVATWPSILLHGAFGVVRVLLPQTGGGMVLYLRLVALVFAPLTALRWWNQRRHPATTVVFGVEVDAADNAAHLVMVLASLVGLRCARQGWTWFEDSNVVTRKPPV